MGMKKAEIPVGVALSAERYQQLLKAEEELGLVQAKLKEYEAGFWGRAAAHLSRFPEACRLSIECSEGNIKLVAAEIRKNTNTLHPEWAEKTAAAVLKRIQREIDRRFK